MTKQTNINTKPVRIKPCTLSKRLFTAIDFDQLNGIVCVRACVFVCLRWVWLSVKCSCFYFHFELKSLSSSTIMNALRRHLFKYHNGNINSLSTKHIAYKYKGKRTHTQTHPHRTYILQMPQYLCSVMQTFILLKINLRNISSEKSI